MEMSTSELYDNMIGYIQEEGHNPLTLDEPQLRDIARTRSWGQSSLRNAFFAAKKLQRSHYGDDFPLNGCSIKHPKLKPQPTLSFQDKETLIRSLNPNKIHHQQYALIFAVLWESWVRASELCSIKVSDIDLDEGTITALTKGGEWEVKGISDITVAMIYGWLQTRPHPSAKTLFFNIKTGKPMTRDGLRGNFNRLAKNAGLKKLTPHMFRRGGVTNAIKNGWSTRLCQIQGGWKQLAMVERYTLALDVQDIRRMLNGGSLEKSP